MDVGILMAVYRPNMEFFEKLLHSLADQTYDKVKIYICDDSDDEQEYENINQVVKEILNQREYYLYRNEKNLGSNKTFENLTNIAQTDWFCYCDQDDIWEKDKISKLVNCALSYSERPKLVYSDLRLIDANDNVIAESFKESRPRLEHVFGKGKDIFPFLLRRNSVTGCAMLIDAVLAKKSMPFPSQKIYVHDHWLAITAALNGDIAYLPSRLVNYRIHSENQIGNTVLPGINNKQQYFEQRVVCERARLDFMKEYLKSKEIQRNSVLEDYTRFLIFRNCLFQNKIFFNIEDFYFSYKKDRTLILFELLLAKSPKVLGEFLLRKIKKD